MQEMIRDKFIAMADPVLQRLVRAGYEAYLVGGCVREALREEMQCREQQHEGSLPEKTRRLDIPSTDQNTGPGAEAVTETGTEIGTEIVTDIVTDIDVTTNALPEEICRVFADMTVIETGIKHGTVTVMVPANVGADRVEAATDPATDPADIQSDPADIQSDPVGAQECAPATPNLPGRGKRIPIEITTYRTDGTYSDGRHPDRVEFVSSLEKDLARRDFTVNAMAMDRQGKVIDPFGGQEDLAAGIIRAVGDSDTRFQEDALRILRALRFAAVLATPNLTMSGSQPDRLKLAGTSGSQEIQDDKAPSLDGSSGLQEISGNKVPSIAGAGVAQEPSAGKESPAGTGSAQLARSAVVAAPKTHTGEAPRAGGFRIEAGTEAALFRCAPLLKKISAERVFAELKKLVCGPGAGDVIRRYVDILAVVVPELAQMKGFTQHNPYHKYDVLEHCIRAMEAVGEVAPIAATAATALTALTAAISPTAATAAIAPIAPTAATASAAPTPAQGPVPASVTQMKLAALLHDVGKPSTFTRDEEGIGHFYGHPHAGAKIVPEILRRLKADRFTIDRITTLVRYHDLVFQEDDRLLKRWMNRYTTQVLLEILELKRADNIATGNVTQELLDKFDRIETRIRAIAIQANAGQACLHIRDLEINGNDLLEAGIPEGPQVGAMLQELLEKVIDGELKNERSELMAAIQSE